MLMKDTSTNIVSILDDDFFVYTILIAFLLSMILIQIFPIFSNSILIFLIQLFNILVIFRVTSKTNKISEKSQANIESLNKLKLKPLISLSLNRSKCWNGYAYSWHLINCSEYAALNVFVRFSKSDSKMSNWVACNSILKDEVELFWIYGAEKIETCYCNVKLDEFYKTVTENCINKFENISKEDYEDIVTSVMIKKNNIADLVTTKILIEDKYRSLNNVLDSFNGEDIRKNVQSFNAKIENLLFEK